MSEDMRTALPFIVFALIVLLIAATVRDWFAGFVLGGIGWYVTYKLTHKD